MKIIIDLSQNYALVFWNGKYQPYVIAHVDSQKNLSVGDEINDWLSGLYYSDLSQAVERFEILSGRKAEFNGDYAIAKAFVDTLLNEIYDYAELSLSEEDLAQIYERCALYREQDSIETTINQWLMTHGYEYNDYAKYVKKD